LVTIIIVLIINKIITISPTPSKIYFIISKSKDIGGRGLLPSEASARSGEKRSALQGRLFLVGVAWWRLRLEVETKYVIECELFN
jgi:hypothetical protein